MLSRIGDHPFLFGLLTTLIFCIAVFGNFTSLASAAQTRGLGLIVFGAAISLLLYRSRDRGDVFWFFLGGVVAVVVSFLVSLKV